MGILTENHQVFRHHAPRRDLPMVHHPTVRPDPEEILPLPLIRVLAQNRSNRSPGRRLDPRLNGVGRRPAKRQGAFAPHVHVVPGPDQIQPASRQADLRPTGVQPPSYDDADHHPRQQNPHFPQHRRPSFPVRFWS